MNKAVYISGQASTPPYFLWMVLLMAVLFIIYSFYKQQQRYNNMRKVNAIKLESLHQELAFKIKLEQDQKELFIHEMTAIKNTFNSFSDRNELKFKRLQLFDVVRICLNSMETYLRIWNQL
jgi:hypothetical protein